MFGSNKHVQTAHPDGTTVTTTTHTTKTTTPHYPSTASNIMSRLRPRNKTTQPHYGATTTTAAPVRTSRLSRKNKLGTHTGTTTVTPRRKTSMGDKMSGAMMKLKGSVTNKPGVKGAGTRRMHGTDGRGVKYY